MPDATVSLKEFAAAIMKSELLSVKEVNHYHRDHAAEDAQSLARRLIDENKITQYQANVLLEGRDDPLLIDRYVILDTIDSGGMGVVFKALHRSMDRIVALKLLPAEAVDSPDKVKRFRREVKASAKLDHPNIVTTYDAHEAKGTHFLVMESVKGADLGKVVRKHGPLSVGRAVNYILQAAHGLAHAHAQGIIHRDIKPGNMVLSVVSSPSSVAGDKSALSHGPRTTDHGLIKVLDMGLARFETDGDGPDDNTEELTRQGVVMGTVSYMAPEQALDTHLADHRSDIYSLGCTLFFLLTGKPPFAEDNSLKTLLAHREKAVPSLTAKSAIISPDLDAVFQKMLAKKPEDRYQSMSEVIAGLEACEIAEDDSTVAIDVDEPAADEQNALVQTASFLTTSRVASQEGRETVFADPKQPQAAQDSAKKDSRPFLLVALAAFFVLAAAITAGVILLRVETPAGTIILEVDQADIDGAVVSIDGQQKITIKTGKDQEPIQVKADGKKRLLEVTKGGFQTFTKEFTAKAGKQTIKVWLEPLVAKKMQKNGGPLSSGKNYALEFDGKKCLVQLPDLEFDLSRPLTIDIIVKPSKQYQYSFPSWRLIGNGGFGLALSVHYAWGAGIPTKKPHPALHSSRSAVIGQLTHLAAVWDGKRLALYVDGKREGDPIVTAGAGDLELPPNGVSRLVIGSRWYSLHPNADENVHFHGIIDEVRISKVARYTKDFTPPKRFEPDKDTLALYHFDEGEGDVLKDSSGNGHYGKIVGAKWVQVDDELKVIAKPKLGVQEK